MKKLLILILIIFTGLSVYSQVYETQGLAVGDPDVAGSNVAVFDSITEVGGFIHFYVGAVEMFALDTTGIYNKLALMAADSFHISGTNIYAFENGDTLVWKDPPSAIVDLDNIKASIFTIFQNDSTTFVSNEVAFWQASTQRYPALPSTVPKIYTAAGDTSNMSTPLKIGDLFIDTTNGIIYVAEEAVTGGWLRISNVP